MKSKKLLFPLFTVLAAAVILVILYAVCPLSWKIGLRGLDGEVLYSYDYSASGKGMILENTADGTITFLDVNLVGPLSIRDVRGYAIYDLESGAVTKLSRWFYSSKYQGIYTERKGELTIGIQVPVNQDGLLDIHILLLGVCDGEPEHTTVYQKPVDGHTLYAAYLTNW